MAKKDIEQDVTDIVYNYKTSDEHGFTDDEMDELLATKFPQVSRKRFSEELGINTVMMIDGLYRTYHEDVARALRCIVNNRSVHQDEWD